MVFWYLGMIWSNIWYNQIVEPWKKHLDTPPCSLKLTFMGLDLKTLFTHSPLSHLWEHKPRLVYFCSAHLGLFHVVKRASGSVAAVNYFWSKCGFMTASLQSSMLPPLSLSFSWTIPHVRAVEGRTQRSSMHGETIYQKAKISYCL